MSRSNELYPMDTDSKRIESVQVYRAKLAIAGSKKPKIRLYNIVFIVLYVLQVGWVLRTVGEPYRLFLEKADREGFEGTHCVSWLCH